MSNIQNQKNINLKNTENSNNDKNIFSLNDSLEEANEDDNNLEYTKSNVRSESKSYRVSDLPLMDNYENFNIKNDPQNNLIEEDEKKSIKNNDNEKNEIDEMYKQIILNKRINMTNKYNTHYNSQSNNNLNSEIFTFNNNNNESIKIPQRSITIINNQFNIENENKKNNNINITNFHNFNNTTFSTQSQTGSRSGKKNNKNLNYNNKLISEFIINDSLSQRNNYIGISDINDNTEENREYLKNWLKSLDLFQYYNNFIENDVYDIHKLVQLMKSYETKLKYDDIEGLLGIKKPGHIFRILIKLEIDSGLIDSNIVKFMIKKNIKENEKNIQISFSNTYECGCFKNNKIPIQKNELRTFLKRKNLMKFYQNFYHNGFELIEYILIQMYSSFPINDDTLENCFHIYDENDRIKVLKSIVNEMKKINTFVNTKEYVSTPDKDKIKYENVQLEDSDNENFNDNLDIENCNACCVF